MSIAGVREHPYKNFNFRSIGAQVVSEYGGTCFPALNFLLLGISVHSYGIPVEVCKLTSAKLTLFPLQMHKREDLFMLLGMAILTTCMFAFTTRKIYRRWRHQQLEADIVDIV